MPFLQRGNFTNQLQVKPLSYFCELLIVILKSYFKNLTL